MDERKQALIRHYGLIILGILCPLIAKICPIPLMAGALEAVWMYSFLELTCRYRRRKDLLTTGIMFMVSYCLTFWGALGSAATTIAVAGIFGLIVYGAFLLAGWAMVRWNHFLMTLAFPAAWLCTYGIATLVRFPSLARVDMLFSDYTVLLQSEHFISAIGLSFALVWILSMFRYANDLRKGWCAAAAGGLFALLLLPGLIMLYPHTDYAQSLRIAYTTGPYIGDFMDYSGISYEANEESMEHSVLGAAEEDAELLVFTEEAFSIKDTEESGFLSRCAELAKENDLAVLLGLDLTDTDGSEGGKSINEVVLIDNTGAILDTYVKTQLIPIIESDYEAGAGVIPSHRLSINGKSVTVSYLICYDSNFPSYVRGMDPDTDILLLPSWDWSAITELHAKLCCTLAAQNQVCVLKPTYDGLSIAVAPDGELLYSSSTDTTGFEHIEVMEMPILSSALAPAEIESLSPLTYAGIGAEIMSVLVCLLLLAVARVRKEDRTTRSRWFRCLVAVDLSGAFADALSWMLDGAAHLDAFLYVTSAVSMVMTLIMIGIFSSYLTAYIRETGRISTIPKIISWSYVAVSVTLTLAACFTGDLFTIQNGSYAPGPLYDAYVAINTMSMFIGIVVVTYYRKALDRTDCIIAYIYMIFPVIIAAINIWVEDWSYAYPSITVSLVMIYIMLQSDKVEKLEEQGEIVSYHASHDALTGLLNRRALNDQFEILKNTDGSSGIIFGDVNGLKYANDHLGHEAGDELLIHFAEILSGIFRASDLYRISGDEFICLMPQVPESSFHEHVRSLQTVLDLDQPPIACIGGAYGRNQEIERLMNIAEAKMYEAKEVVHEQFPEFKR